MAGLKTVDDLFDQVECCSSLADHFRSLAADELDEIQSRIEDDDGVLDDPNDGWKAWMRAVGSEGLPQYTKIIKDCLAEPADWRE